MVDSIDDAERRRRLDALSHALRPLHKALVDVVQADWERANGRIGGPVQLFQLLTTDAFFLWLHPMSALMAEFHVVAVRYWELATIRQWFTGQIQARGIALPPLYEPHPDRLGEPIAAVIEALCSDPAAPVPDLTAQA